MAAKSTLFTTDRDARKLIESIQDRNSFVVRYALNPRLCIIKKGRAGHPAPTKWAMEKIPPLHNQWISIGDFSSMKLSEALKIFKRTAKGLQKAQEKINKKRPEPEQPKTPAEVPAQPPAQAETLTEEIREIIREQAAESLPPLRRYFDGLITGQTRLLAAQVAEAVDKKIREILG